MCKELKKTFENVSFEISYAFTWVKDKYYDVKRYIHNRIIFDKILREWNSWDYSYQIDLFKFGMTQLREALIDGNEEDVSRMKKVAAITELINELSRDVEDEAHVEVFGKNYNYTFDIDDDGKLVRNNDFDKDEHKKLVDKFNKLYHKKRNELYDNIFRLIKGQDAEELSRRQDEIIKKLSEKQKEEAMKEGYYSIYKELFDGSGIEGWWD